MAKDIKKIYLNKTVYQNSKERIKWLFDEFDNVVVGFSGGKDSTVCLNLTLEVAEELGKLPVTVVFLDQEAEYQNVIDYVTDVMHDERVNPFWIQAPFKINNATSFENPWLYCWEENGEWIREKHPISHKTNDFGAELFHDLFKGIINYLHPNETACYISGVRSEESPARHTALTQDVTYKGETWGKQLNKSKGHYTFYPIYDWSYLDIWKSIYDNKWQYCKIYDLQYQYGIALKDMRVSNLHHETSIHSLFFLQEVEPDTWNKLVKRLDGINTTTKIGVASYKRIKTLPYMFDTWTEYRDYLLEKLVTLPKYQEGFRKMFAKMDDKYNGMLCPEDMKQAQIASILTNDFEYTKLKNWMISPAVGSWYKYKRDIFNEYMIGNKYIPQEGIVDKIKAYNERNKK